MLDFTQKPEDAGDTSLLQAGQRRLLCSFSQIV
jgi:hypothetical protein